jgi:hypothetical protein
MKRIWISWTLGSGYAQEAASGSTRLKHRDNVSQAAASKPADDWFLATYFRELASQEKALADSYQRIGRDIKKTKPPAGVDAAGSASLVPRHIKADDAAFRK